MAEEYRPSWRDRLRRRSRRDLLARLRARVEPEGKRLLDLGGGTGVATVAFGDGARERVVLEPNEKRIRSGRRAHAPVTFVAGVAEAIPFEPGRFDRVVSLMSFHHFSDGEKACREAARVLAPGGRLVIYDFDRGPPPARLVAFWVVRVRHRTMHLLTTSELEQVVRKAGFRNVRREAYGGGAFVTGER
jgi:ubiquinone/menaquinone biosynthesis C-methylase UbiE